MCIYEWEQQRRPTDAGHFSFFLFSFFLFFFSLFYRVRATNFRPISISLHPRVRVFEFRIDSLSSSTLLDVDRDNKARLIGSYNRTDRCSLSHFIFIYIYSSRVDHGEIRACKFLVVEKNEKDNKGKRTELFSLDPRDSKRKIQAEFQTRYAAMAYL